MFAMLRRLSRPFLGLGRKIGNFFRIGRKGQVVNEVRNTVNVIPEGVRIPNYNPDHIDYATKYRDIWGQVVIRD
jgi:hypothetical protein